MGKRGHRLRSGIISYGFLILGSVVMLVPFIWMILTSFKTYAEAVKIPVVWFPAEWNLDNYRDVLLRLDFLQYYTLLPIFYILQLAFRIEFHNLQDD